MIRFNTIKWNSIHAKLLATYLLLTVTGTSLLAVYTLWSFYDYFIQTRQEDLKNWTDALAESIADAMEDQDLERINILVKRYGAADNVTLRVFSPQAQLLSTSDPADRQIQDWLKVPGVKESMESLSTQGIAKGILSRDDRLYISKPIIRNGKLLGAMRMSLTLKQFQRQFARVTSTVLGTLGLTILLCAIISDRLAHSLSQPIKTMRNFAIRLGSGHFGDRLTIRQSNELDQLAVELNRMSVRLASLDEERRAFLANVSHELRTPISNVHVTVEALQNGAIEEPQLRDRFLQTIQDETKRLSRLIHDLLDLGRLEAGVTALEKQTVSLSNLVLRAIRAMEPRLQSKQITPHLKLIDLQVWGDPERLLQCFLNILDNAIKHSSRDSKIRVMIYRDGLEAKIQVQDQGPGIASQDLVHIFEQFYTTDPSRQGNGTGLGLAIAKRIIEAHGGSLQAESVAGDGATFTISLPVLQT